MLIVDAYNVLHCTHILPAPYALMEVAELCRLIERTGWASRGAAVVCDGVRKPTEGDYLGPVERVYVGKGRDADSRIEAMLEAADQPRAITVVSNDRRVQRAAKRRRATPMTSERFLRLLVKADRPSKASKPKPAPPDEREVEAWLREFELERQPEQQIKKLADEPPATPSHRGSADSPASDEPETPDPDDSVRDLDRPRRDDRPAASETDYWLREFGLDQDGDR